MPLDTKSLSAARKNKADEFYTLMETIQRELSYYKGDFKGKVVFCNCDDPQQSNFYKYFKLKFKSLKLKKLIATHYCHSILFEDERSYKIEYDGKRAKKTWLKGDGDFRSVECLELLEKSDIVVTNPPFSLFREYITQLMEYKKNFLIIGNLHAITYKEIFPYIQNNRMWLGITPRSGGIDFKIPEEYLKQGELQGSNIQYLKDGTPTINVSPAIWFTNLDHEQRNEMMPLYERYKENKSKFPKYDNYNAISVEKRREIPEDYEGEIGVPVSFLQRYNPKQFKIIGADWQLKKTKLIDDKKDRFYLDGQRKYSRLVIKHKKPKK